MKATLFILEEYPADIWRTDPVHGLMKTPGFAKAESCQIVVNRCLAKWFIIIWCLYYSHVYLSIIF